jgi:hypothetical protein
LFNVTRLCKVVRYWAWMRGVRPFWFRPRCSNEASLVHRRSGATRRGQAGRARGPSGANHGRGLRGKGGFERPLNGSRGIPHQVRAHASAPGAWNAQAPPSRRPTRDPRSLGTDGVCLGVPEGAWLCAFDACQPMGLVRLAPETDGAEIIPCVSMILPQVHLRNGDFTLRWAWLFEHAVSRVSRL